MTEGRSGTGPSWSDGERESCCETARDGQVLEEVRLRMRALRTLLDDGIDFVTIERIHRGEFDDWICALTGSGLFTNEEIRSIGREWRKIRGCSSMPSSPRPTR